MANGRLVSLLQEKEVILLESRRHWSGPLSAIVLEMIIAAVIVAAVTAMIDSVPAAAVGYVLVLVPLAIMAYDVLNWVNRKVVLSNRRVIRVEGVFNKTVTDARIEEIADAKMTQSALGELFG